MADFNQRADLSLETADELEAYHAEQEDLIESLNEELAEQVENRSILRQNVKVWPHFTKKMLVKHRFG